MNFQRLSFILSLFISLYLLGFAIPSQIETRFQPAPPGSDKTAETTAVSQSNWEKPAIPEPISGLTDGVQIKASGEEGFPADEAIKSLAAVKEEFQRRFGSSFDEAWTGQEPIRHSFPVPEAIRGMVDFWIQVFGRYDKDQYLFHHKDHVAIVYSAIDLTGLDSFSSGLSPQMSEMLKKQFILEEKIRISKILSSLADKLKMGNPGSGDLGRRETLTTEEKRLAELFARESSTSLATAGLIDNIKVQGGFKNRFRNAIRLSGLYMQEMENIFTTKGLPVELTRIPFVESAFNITAVSSAEAMGLWQFIYPTGKRYLKIDSWADERLDPILSTYAAAQHLANEYKLLGSWPLTINAYNTGPGRMIKARAQLKTDDIAVIIKKFEDPGYQFYSRNYYPEFLAALYVYENQEQFFGKIAKLPPLQYELFMPQDTVNLASLAQATDMDLEVLENLNPALAEDVLDGTYSLPAGYLVKVPKNFGVLFARAAVRFHHEIRTAEWHIVEENQTAASIADYYRIPVERLEEINNLIPGEPIAPGTIIKLPRDTGIAMTPEEETETVVQ
ncbi:MAG: transglycosylase SLT domain-containing protein [Deltaproteobacteria bacterium]|nr:transglycosylase SLT domain-containing protein [Deltaproteobacteria bacterium]